MSEESFHAEEIEKRWVNVKNLIIQELDLRPSEYNRLFESESKSIQFTMKELRKILEKAHELGENSK